MKFSDFVCTKAVQSQLTAEDKESVIRELVDALVKAGKIQAQDSNDIVKAILKREELGSTGIGRGVAAVRHRSGARSYTYYGIATLSPEFALFDSQGTVFGALTKSSFAAIKIIAPTDEIVRAFESHTAPIDDQIKVLDEQSRSLASMRDTLLPKLLSGELRIDDPENFLATTLD